MTSGSLLYLERPAFWTETSDPESWFRALGAFAAAVERSPQRGTPRAVADRVLSGLIARRGAAGLFGVFVREGRTLLPGVGLLTLDHQGEWDVTDEARTLLRSRKEDGSRGLEALARYLVRESPWLRMLLLRLHRSEWELSDWARVRSGRRGIQAGTSLVLNNHAEPESWFEGLEQQSAARWLARTGCVALAYDPDVLTRAKRRDNLSLTPLTAPLRLLESVGWLSRTGELALPSELAADVVGKATAAQALTDITQSHADVSGFVAAEPVLRELLATFGLNPREDAFALWMDELTQQAMAKGALELLDAQPGQSRHGRGLNADPSRKLVRWVIHPEFNDVFQNNLAALESERELTR